MQDQDTQKLPESAPRAQEKLLPGDIVYLNSGSPPLTVERLGENISVRWIDREGRSQSMMAPPVCFTREVRHAQD